MALQLATLANNLDQIPTLVAWFESEWPDYFADRDTAAFLEAQANPDTLPLALLMYDDDELVGTVAIKRESIDAYAELSPWVAGLYVKPEARGRGIGQVLANIGARVAFESGAEKVYAGAGGAGKVFEAAGWKAIGEAEQDGEKVTIYELDKPAQPPNYYDIVGGEAKVRALVDRFYDLMDQLPQAKEVRDMHARSLRTSRQKLFEFLSGWMGGPNLYIEKHGHPRLRARHLPFSIGTEARDQWLMCMDQALDEIVEDERVREELKDSFARIADHMRNRQGP